MTTKFQGTPGPWKVMRDAVCRKVAWKGTPAQEAAPGITICSPSNTEPICRVSGYLQPLEANARLIAAAPELLEALHNMVREWKEVVGDSEHNATPGDTLEKAESALARALPAPLEEEK